MRLFKTKNKCEHEYKIVDKYYRHHLTEFSYGSDSVVLVTVNVCRKCSHIQDNVVHEKFFPANNVDSTEMKRQYLKLLKDKGIKSQEEYLLDIINSVNK